MIVKDQLKEAQLELVTDATLPAAGKKGRIVFNLDTLQGLIDDGNTWRPLGGAPVGSVQPSTLTEVQFQAEAGNDWVLCNGGSAVGSDYESITGNANVPDFRGLGLRGDNGLRFDALADPDGSKPLGSGWPEKTSGDALSGTADTAGSHTHPESQVAVTGFGTFIANLDGGGGIILRRETDAASGSHTHSLSVTGDNQTHGAHGIVNYFIKINR